MYTYKILKLPNKPKNLKYSKVMTKQTKKIFSAYAVVSILGMDLATTRSVIKHSRKPAKKASPPPPPNSLNERASPH